MKRLSVLTIIEGICTLVYANDLSESFKTPPDSARPGSIDGNPVVSTNLGLAGTVARPVKRAAPAKASSYNSLP